MRSKKENAKYVSSEQSIQKKVLTQLVATTSHLPVSSLAGLEFRMHLGHRYKTYPWMMKLEKSFGKLLENIYLPRRGRRTRGIKFP